MSLLAAWVLFPALLAAIATGNGLLLRRLAGVEIPGALIVPAGLALVVVAVQTAVARPGVGVISTPLVVALAVAGFVVDRGWRPLRLDRAALAVGVVVLLVYGAPVILSGTATFAGYIKLDDTATFLALTDRAMTHGRSLAGLPPSTYEAVLAAYNATDYPLGSMLPLGAVGPLSFQDLAWLYQPWIAFLAAATGLGLYTLAREILSPGRAALAAGAASCSSLLFGFAFWGGVKEVATAWLVVLAAALVPGLIRDRGARALLPLGVVAAAMFDTLTPLGLAWLGPAVLVGLVVRFRHGFGRIRISPRAIVIGLAAAAILALPAALSLDKVILGSRGLRTGHELGNLVRPLKWQQVFGVWLGPDFRIDPRFGTLTTILIGVVIAGAAAGVVFALRRGAWGIVAYAAAAVVGSVGIAMTTGPWVTAKTLAIVSPTALLLCFVGLLALRRVEGVVAAAALAGGLLAGNAMAYHQTFLAPRDRLDELARIGDLAAGKGPTLLPLYDPYASRHFLRKTDPEESSELRRRQVFLQSGKTLPTGSYADLDALRQDSVSVYRTIVVPRSPIFSRPPSVYRRTWRGRFFDVYERAPGAERTILAHQGLGSATQVAAPAGCDVVGQLGRQARRSGGHLAFVEREPAVFAEPYSGRYPRAWGRGSAPGTLAPWTGGTLRLTPSVPLGGRYDLWLAGSFASDAEIVVNGERVGQVSGLGNQGNYAPAGSVRLEPGLQVVEIRYPRRALSPGTGVPLAQIGNLALAPAGNREAKVQTLPAERATSLCGRSLDWIEVVRG